MSSTNLSPVLTMSPLEGLVARVPKSVTLGSNEMNAASSGRELELELGPEDPV
jgi:hypothetical protein